MNRNMICVLVSFVTIACSPLARNTQHLDLVDREAFVENDEDWISNENESVLADEQTTVHVVNSENLTPMTPQRQQYPQFQKPSVENSDKLIIPLFAISGMITGFPFDFLDAAFSGQKMKYKYTIRGGLIGTALGVGFYYLTKDDEKFEIEPDDETLFEAK